MDFLWPNVLLLLGLIPRTVAIYVHALASVAIRTGASIL
jgi:hypothetical protein